MRRPDEDWKAYINPARPPMIAAPYALGPRTLEAAPCAGVKEVCKKKANSPAANPTGTAAAENAAAVPRSNKLKLPTKKRHQVITTKQGRTCAPKRRRPVNNRKTRLISGYALHTAREMTARL